eukprot:TRINITY_DN7480_c0_g1_i2.p1 TRINITY_DN7480_c0_g1~~TRINITY_DN7480_c0_g1_i2.p1  ORF type:complete len:294 (+),score=71.16 TRINITY_DN7480_c0_g1_i2:72-953(+)
MCIRDRNIHVTLVIHPRKVDDNVDLSVSSVFGTAKATQEADNILIIQNRPKFKLVEVKKNRFDGELGRVPLGFDKDTKRFVELTENEVLDLHKTPLMLPELLSRRSKSPQIAQKATPKIEQKTAPLTDMARLDHLFQAMTEQDQVAKEKQDLILPPEDEDEEVVHAPTKVIESPEEPEVEKVLQEAPPTQPQSDREEKEPVIEEPKESPLPMKDLLAPIWMKSSAAKDSFWEGESLPPAVEKHLTERERAYESIVAPRSRQEYPSRGRNGNGNGNGNGNLRRSLLEESLSRKK